MQKKAFFIDIDGTLIADSLTIPAKNIAAIDTARAKGHKVFINTGRSKGNIPPELLSQVEFDGILSGNGTVIEIDNKVISKAFLPAETVFEFAEICFRKPELWSVFEGFNHSYAVTGRQRKPSNIEIPVDSFEEFRKIAENDRFQVIATGKNADSEVMDYIEKHFNFFEFTQYFDIAPKGCNKANAMIETARLFGISVSDCIAIGDSNNDLEMLKAAGAGIAVANAQEELLKHADYITLSNRECGVGAAIIKIISEREQ